jgi:ribonuclease P/MRP protein subunit POP5
MSTRPPTLRENRRYILTRVEPAGTIIDQKELYYTIAEAVTSLWGDAMAAVIMAAVVAAEEGHVIIRCRRGSEKELAIALSTVTSCRNVRLALRIVAASGTIESLRERIRPVAQAVPDGTEPGEIIFDKKSCSVLHCKGQKLDVIDKGFKNTNRLFISGNDLELP